MEDIAYLTIAIQADEKVAMDCLRQAIGHLQWGGITVIGGGATNEE